MDSWGELPLTLGGIGRRRAVFGLISGVARPEEELNRSRGQVIPATCQLSDRKGSRKGES